MGMGRGTARSPSQAAYKGALGQTQTRTVHVTTAQGDLVTATVHTTIDAVTDPELVERLFASSLNTIRIDDGSAHEVATPVVYHDPAAEVFVLVLSEAHRHREIEERIQLLERMRGEDTPVPAYVKDFTVVFGARGLRAFLELQAERTLATRAESKEVEKKKSELQSREAELERLRQELDHDKAEVKRKHGEYESSMAELRRAQLELQRDRTELERMRAEARQRVIAAVVQQPEEATTIAPRPSGGDDVTTKPISRQDVEDIETSMVSALPKVDFDEGPTHRAGANSHGTHEGDPRPKVGARDGTHPDPLVSGRNGATHAAVSFEEPTAEKKAMRVEVEVDDEPTGNEPIPSGTDPLTTTTAEGPLDKDKWADAAAKAQTSVFAVVDGRARLALVAGEQISRGLTGNLDVRVLLHRLSSYPVVTMLIGPPVALRTPKPQQVVVLPLEIGNDGDRAVLTLLAKKFELTVDIIQRGQSVRRVRLTAPLADNIAYIVRAADDSLRGIRADAEMEADYARARDLVLGAGYDLLGVEHREATEFRDDKLVNLDTAQAVRRALAIARRFARPSKEDYLVCARGYPLARWRELRRGVLEHAVSWGIWMGSELAQIAVSEGLARSRRDLVLKLDAGFETLRRDQAAFDLDPDAADDNVKALAEEAKALGVELRRKPNGAIKSEDVATVSGSIDGTPPKGFSRHQTTDELIALLDDKVQRVGAAQELCDRGDPRAAAAVVNAVKKMSRAEAVRILGKCIKFGPAAAPALIEGLSSSKAFLRHGCALALALLRTDEGTHAVIDLLLAEPTEIWREVARAVGQIGPPALMPLAAHVGRLADGVTASTQERVAWAMAHVGVRGGKSALDQMAAGQSVMAPIAKKALELHDTAARDEVRVRPGPASQSGGKDVTVNRAFSRRFFEALEADRPDVAQAALHDLDASSPLEVLDEADLIVEEEDEESELDESDLIQT
jgi:hypothetical protein